MNESREFEKAGLEFLNNGKDRKALESFGKAVGLDNLNYSALRSLLFTAHRIGLTPDATRTIQDLLQNNVPCRSRLRADDPTRITLRPAATRQQARPLLHDL